MPAAIVAALVVAEAAVLLLRPRDGVIDPAPVEPSSYFSAQQIDRAEDYRGPQRWLAGGVMAIELAVLVLFVARPPARLRGEFKRPLVAGAVTGAALSVTLATAPLPLQLIARERAKDVGLVTRSWGGYAQDRALSTLIGAGIAGVGAGAGLWLIRRAPRRWWIAGSGVIVAFGVGSIYAGPVVIDPLFNKFEKLPPGQTRDDVLELARKADVDVGEVYRVDASKRTTAINAYVTGIGHSKRVVLYDNLIDDFDRDETKLVVAHELAHVHYDDVPHGLLFLALVAPMGMFAVAQVTRRLAPPGQPGPATIPAIALSIAIVATPVTMISNQLSRRVEARADSFSLRLTDRPDAFISFEKGIALRNISDVTPPGLWHGLMGTHPTTMDRIGIGKAYEEGKR